MREAKAFRALRESFFFERQRKVTKRKPPRIKYGAGSTARPAMKPPGPQAGREFP
jgi:hypothetical protein